MDKKTLNAKAVDIKGKKYVLVADRVNFFNDTFPNGSIRTELISEPNAERVIVRAIVTPDTSKSDRVFSDYSQATIGDGYINKTSALENCSTSAVGRALALMGIGVIDSIASVDELNKTTYPQYATKETTKGIVPPIPEHDANKPPLNWEGDTGGKTVGSLNSKGYKGGVGTKRMPIKDLDQEDVEFLNNVDRG